MYEKPLKKAEDQLRDKLEKEGWEVTHKGWPDFACFRHGQVVLVEVKAYRGEMLKKEQHFLLTTLARYGIDCYRWDPTSGFEQITSATELPEPRKRIHHQRRLTYQEKLAELPEEERKKVLDCDAKGIPYYI